MSIDLKAQQIRVNKIINSGSNSTLPLLVYGLGSATDESGGIQSAHFTTGSDTWLFISGAAGSKGGSTRGAVTFAGDLTISGTIYNAAGTAYAVGSSVAGANTQIQFNDNSSFAGTGNLTFATGTNTLTTTNLSATSLTASNIVSVSPNALVFTSTVTQLELATSGTNITIAGSAGSSALTFSLGSSRSGDSTLNLLTGPASSTKIKTINIGSGGGTGSSTIINMGTVSSTGATTVNVSGSLYMTGTILPGNDLQFTLGSPEKRWAHVYTGDLHLRNDRGDWTIIEEPDFLRIRNNKTGKSFKLLMSEID